MHAQFVSSGAIVNINQVKMAMQTWLGTDALRSACDKGHNWITSRANKFKTMKCGYSKIQPRLLPKGLTIFKKEHCEGFDEDKTEDNFLKCRGRTQSVDVIDHRMRADFHEHNEDGVALDFRVMNADDVNVSVEKIDGRRRKSEALQAPSNVELKVMTPGRYKRRNSKQNTKIIIKATADESLKILPSVLLTYNEKFINIGDKSVKNEKVDKATAVEPRGERIFTFKVRTESMKSIDI